MKSFKDKFKSPFKDKWNNLTKAGRNYEAYLLFLETFPKFQPIEPNMRVKMYGQALQELGLTSK